MTETELQAEIKRLKDGLSQQGMQAMRMDQQFVGVGSTCYALLTEMLMAIGDPEDQDAMRRAKAHTKEFLKNWEHIMEQKAKQNAPPPAPTSNGASSS